MATSTYVTLEPITYLDGDHVREITKDGVLVRLDDVQAAALAGSIAFLNNDGTYEEAPRVETLHYATATAFPLTGRDATIYLAEDSGNLFRWNTSSSSYVQIADAVIPSVAIASPIHAAPNKTTPVDADELPLLDSAGLFSLARVTWANIKATFKSYYDTVASALTNKDLTSGTNTFPTFNQSTSGNAATATKLATARNINGVAFDGTANITVVDSTKLATSAVVDNADGTVSVGSALVMEPLIPASAVVTASTSPAIGKITLYNAAGGNLTPAMPALSGLTAGRRLAVRRDPADTSTNTVTLSLPGGDTFYSSGATSFTLPLTGEQREFQVVSVSASKYWMPAGSLNPLGALDGRYAASTTVYMPAPSGDITGVTDAANLVAAQAKLPAGVGSIIWGSGTYWLTGNNDIPSMQQWYGQGISATTLRLARGQSINLIRTKNFETYKVSDTTKNFGVASNFVTATISSATSTFLSNVITAASTTGANVGDIISASGFNSGTYITAVTATSITVSGYCNFGTTGTLTVTCTSLPTQFGFHDMTLDGNGLVGGQNNNKIVNPPAGLTVTPTGATGSTTYSYRVTAVNSIGETQSSAAVTIANGNATLNGTNYNAISWSAVTGATSYNVYAGFGTNEHWVANVAGTSYSHQTVLFSSFATGQFFPMNNTTAGRVLALCGFGWSMSNVDVKNGCGLGMDILCPGPGGGLSFATDFSAFLSDVHVLGNAGGGARIMGLTDSFWSGALFIANGITGGSAVTNGLTNLDAQSAGWQITNYHFWGGGVQTGVRLAGQLCTLTAGQLEDGHDYLCSILGRGNVIDDTMFYNTASNDAGCIGFYDSGVNNRIQATGRDVKNGVLKLGISSTGALPPGPMSVYDFIMAYETMAPPSTLLWGTLDPSVNYHLRLNNRFSGNTTTVTAQAPWLLRTVTKTANYTLNAGEFVEADATSGALTMTLPTAPPHGTRCGGKKMDGSSAAPGSAVSFATGGSDKVNTSSGGTTYSLSQTNQAVIMQYDSSTSCWIVVSSDFPKGVMDVLYEAKANKDQASGYAGLNGSSQLTKDTTGNAATATKLATARNINGVAFDGTANITVWARSVVSVTGSTTLGAAANTDYVALIGSGGTATLPTAASNTSRYVLKNVDSAAHSVLTTSSQTIEGVTSYSLAAGDSIEVISDGSNWKVI